MASKPKVLKEIFFHKQIKDNGDIIDIKIEQIERTGQYTEGVIANLLNNGTYWA